MKAEEIYQSLKRNGYNASKVAEALNVRPQSVATVIREGRGSKRIARAVAIAGDCAFEDMFPFYQVKKTMKQERLNKVNELRNKLGEFS